jgi:hypothetical protein
MVDWVSEKAKPTNSQSLSILKAQVPPTTDNLKSVCDLELLVARLYHVENK